MYVSTDSDHIVEVAATHGAEVVKRPTELASDDAADLGVFEHFLAWLKVNGKERPDVIVHLRPTSPLRAKGLIDQCVTMLLESTDAHSVRTVVKTKEVPFKMWTMRKDGRLEPIANLQGSTCEAFNLPSHLLPTVFQQNACVDVMWASTITRLESTSGTVIVPVVMDYGSDIYINHEEDFIKAEALFAQKGTNMTLHTISSNAAANMLVWRSSPIHWPIVA